MANIPSPGNSLTPEVPPMRMPHLEHIYRVVADMAPNPYDIPFISGRGISRSVIPIAGGTIVGPRIKGKILENSGADWAYEIHAEKVFYRLEARYTVVTDDGHYILINARGLFRLGPGVNHLTGQEPSTTQDEAEYFSHLTFEASEDSPYSWMNGIVTVGVMTMWENRVVIDAYRLTNFPGKEAEDLFVPMK